MKSAPPRQPAFQPAPLLQERDSREKAQKAQRGIAHALARISDAVNQSVCGRPWVSTRPLLGQMFIMQHKLTGENARRHTRIGI